MSGHFICDQAAKERASGLKMTDLEAKHVAAVVDDNTKFKCIPCDTVFHKKSALVHFTKGKLHGIDPKEVQKWIVTADARALKDKKEHLCVLHLCHQEAPIEHTGDEELGEDEGHESHTGQSDLDVAGSSSQPSSGFVWIQMPCLVKCTSDGVPVDPLECKLMNMQATPKASPPQKQNAAPPASSEQESQATQLLHDLVSRIEAVSAPAKLEVEILDLVIADSASSWTHPTNTKQRMTYPLSKQDESSVSMKGFETYLTKILRQNAKSTVKMYLLALSRLFQILRVKDEKKEVDFKAYLVTMYKMDWVHKLQDLPLLDMRYGWSRMLVFAVDHLCSFGIAQASKEEHPRTEHFLKLLQNEVLHAWKGDAYEAKSKGNIAKQHVDGLRLENLPRPEHCKAAVHRAMCHLAILSERSQEVDPMSMLDRQMANVALAGIVIYNTFAGRSMEWHLMNREEVKAAMMAGAKEIVCDHHKTAKYYGSIAKWIPEGLRRALLTYCSLPNKISNRLLEPAKVSSSSDNHFHLGPALKAFGKYYSPKQEYPRINLIRKLFHSILVRLSREGDALELIGKADGHSASMGLKTYALAGPKEDVAVGELVYKQAFGDPVPWPTAEDIQCEKKSFALSSLAFAAVLTDIKDEDIGSGDEEMDATEDATWTKHGDLIPLFDAEPEEHLEHPDREEQQHSEVARDQDGHGDVKKGVKRLRHRISSGNKNNMRHRIAQRAADPIPLPDVPSCDLPEHPAPEAAAEVQHIDDRAVPSQPKRGRRSTMTYAQKHWLQTILPGMWGKEQGQPPNFICQAIIAKGVASGMFVEGEAKLDAVRYHAKKWSETSE